MQYAFDEIELAGVVLPIEGFAEFDHDPREPRRHMPVITIHGYRPGAGPPIRADLCLSNRQGGTDSNNSACVHLNYSIRYYLMTRHFKAICEQWDAEYYDRRAASQADAAAIEGV